MSKYLIWILTPFILFSQSILADTHYVATTGMDNSDCTSKSTPCLSIGYGISQMSGGDTLEIADGTYSGVANDIGSPNIPSSVIPSGTSANYTIIKAENIDSATSHVTTTSLFNITGGPSGTKLQYVEVHGLKVKSTIGKSINGDYIKVFKTGFEGGPSTNNTVTLAVGFSTNILLEDIWSYGKGGRYNLLLYNAQNIVVRRAVIRHDGGWACDGSNPEAGITVYNSRYVELQNVIVLDGISDLNTAGGACQGHFGFYNVSNASGGTQHENTRTVGSIAFNNAVGSGIAWDDFNPIPNALLENSAIYNSGTGISSNGTYKDVTIKNVTIVATPFRGIAKFGNNNTYNISNTLIYQSGLGAIKSVPTSDIAGGVLCFANNGENGVCNVTNTDPASSGLSYITRIEVGSYLATAGIAGAQIGANIVSKTGASGTLYNETNFNTEQDALWPWPNETRIASDMCAVRSTGMCSTSLTDYIWGALGTTTPANLQPMAKPTGLSIIKNP